MDKRRYYYVIISLIFLQVISAAIVLIINFINISANNSSIIFYAESFIFILTLVSFAAVIKFKKKIFDQDLENMALTDGLTGLYNRRYFDMFYENIFNQSSRYGIPLTLIMCDIDHFKKINDTYGHDKGDVVLKEIADILKSNTRKTDIAARFGGEEFMLCLPSTEITSALDVARKIKQMVLNVKTKDIKKVTISMGVTFYRKEFESNPKGLLKRLDDLLYEAKKRGRNRIISEDHTGDIIEVEENPWLDE
ncbi:MAG: GGDEF domain-containing protein [Candidatus Acidulodesulfobacterium sp.]